MKTETKNKLIKISDGEYTGTPTKDFYADMPGSIWKEFAKQLRNFGAGVASGVADKALIFSPLPSIPVMAMREQLKNYAELARGKYDELLRHFYQKNVDAARKTDKEHTEDEKAYARASFGMGAVPGFTSEQSMSYAFDPPVVNQHRAETLARGGDAATKLKERIETAKAAIEPWTDPHNDSVLGVVHRALSPVGSMLPSDITDNKPYEGGRWLSYWTPLAFRGAASFRHLLKGTPLPGFTWKDYILK